MKHDTIDTDLKALIDELRLTPTMREEIWSGAFDQGPAQGFRRTRIFRTVRVAVALMGLVVIAVLAGTQLLPDASQRPTEKRAPVDRGLDRITASSSASQTTVPTLDDIAAADMAYIGTVSYISEPLRLGLVPVHIVRLDNVRDVHSGEKASEREIGVIEGTRSVVRGETYLVATNETLLADIRKFQYPIFMGRATGDGYVDNIQGSDHVVTRAEVKQFGDVERDG